MVIKRWTAAVLVCVLLACVFALPSAATSSATITVGTVSGQKGDIVELPVKISANSYMVNADLLIKYDATRLELVKDYYDGACFKGGTVFGSRWVYNGAEQTAGVFWFSVATGNSTGLSAGGEMFRIALRILKDDVQSMPVTVTVDPIYGNDGLGEPDVSGYPVDYYMPCTMVDGAVRIGTSTTEPPVEKLMGDLNFDGNVNMRDALILYQSVSGRVLLTDERREVSDFTGDGNVNMRDALYLYSKVSGKIA